MKKSICILFAFFLLLTSLFADKNLFYADGKVIDTMYVNSKEGLSVRDYPSLNSNRLCGLPHRLPVKVVAIGKEVTIDGITAPWVEILIPRYEWKCDNPEYGWVFGGYLKETQPEFEAPATKEELKTYLTSFWTWKQIDDYGWEDSINNLNESYFSCYFFGLTCFSQDDYYALTWNKTCEDGKYSVLSSDIVLLELTAYEWEGPYEDPNNTPYESTRTYSRKIKIQDITENMFSYVVLDNETGLPSGMKQICTGFSFVEYSINLESVSLYLNDFSGIDRYSMLETRRGISERYGSEKHLNRDYYYTADYEYNVSVLQAATDFIKAGVSAKGTKYEAQYQDYWYPIMAEHQKRADEMSAM